MAAAVIARGLGKRYGKKRAVSGLEFEVAEGEVFGLLGPNGAGKTSTLRMIAGLLPPDEGEAIVCGFDARREARQIRERVGLLTEQPGLYDRLSSLENLAFFGRLYGVPPREIAGRAERLLRPLGLWEQRHDRAGTLSKGTRQKLAIARALFHEPKVVLLDEPTSALDPESARNVRDIIAGLAAEGRTLVLCTHNLFEAERLCRRVAIVRAEPGLGGRMLAMTEVGKLRRGSPRVTIELEGPAEPHAAAVQAMEGVHAAAATGPKLDVDFDEGRGVDARVPDPVPDIVALLVARGARLRAVVPTDRPLEEAYLSLVAEAGAA
ncbi:MAG: ABC transporter ATP-binding protein [Deltaproteobacteria bacterium]